MWLFCCTADCLNWTVVPPNPTKVTRGSNVSLEWAVTFEDQESFDFSYFSLLMPNGQQEKFAQINQHQRITKKRKDMTVTLKAGERVVLEIHCGINCTNATKLCYEIWTSNGPYMRCQQLKYIGETWHVMNAQCTTGCNESGNTGKRWP